MTEDEAKTKWCPHARVGVVDSGMAINLMLMDDNSRRYEQCIASACMMWVWNVPKTVGAGQDIDRSKYGHCGLCKR